MAPALPGQAILVSHGIVAQWEPGRPVSMSARALGALRGRLPEVLLISDDLQMQGLQRVLSTHEACVQGIQAGLDVLLIGNNLLDETALAAGFAEALARAAAVDGGLARQVGAALTRVRARKRQYRAPSPD